MNDQDGVVLAPVVQIPVELECRIALQKAPDDAAVFSVRAYVFAGKQDHAGALRDIEAALKLDPRYALAYVDRGLIHLERKQYAEAAADLQRAVELRPILGYALAYRSVALEMLGKHQEAAADFAAAQKLHEGSAFFDRSFAYILVERHDQSDRDVDETLRRMPENVGALLARADRRIMVEKNMTGALVDIEKARSLAPSSSVPYLRRAEWFDLQDKLDEALADLDRALKTDPDFVQARAMRGSLLVDKDRLQDAVRECAAALAIDPDCLEALHTRGLAYIAWNEFADEKAAPASYESAIADLDRAAGLAPKFGQPFAVRGACHYYQGHHGKAFEIKWDGVRALTSLTKSAWRVWGREGVDYTDRYPELAALCRLPAGTVLDGELVAIRDGRPDSLALMSRHARRPRPGPFFVEAVKYVVFDILYCRGQCLMDRHWRSVAPSCTIASALSRACRCAKGWSEMARSSFARRSPRATRASLQRNSTVPASEQARRDVEEDQAESEPALRRHGLSHRDGRPARSTHGDTG